MHITWHGQYTVKIASKDAAVIIDPYAPSVGLPAFRGKADVVALSNPADKTMSHTSGLQGEPIIINTPGEYSLRGMALHAIPWQTEEGQERSLLQWLVEGINVVHMGALTRELSQEELQVLERTGIDILIIPVGAGTALNTKMALSLVSKIEPRIVIPIHYKIPKVTETLDPVDTFAKEMGVSPKGAEDKLTVRANRLPPDDMVTVILKA